MLDFHQAFIDRLGNHLVSRYPERDGNNYYPHITAEYGGRMVIDTSHYAHKKYTLKKVWLLKDAKDSEDSLAYKSFVLGT